MQDQVTVLLQKWRGGSTTALDELLPLVYDQLRGLARHYMRGERGEHTLGPTAVVHEAYLRLAGTDVEFADRAHYYAVAATVMRHVLLDWAKSHKRTKRGGEFVRVELNESAALEWSDPLTVIEVDRVLEKLAAFDGRKARIVEMIFYGGLTYEEAAEVMQLSAVTIHRELKMAKAWMYHELMPRSEATHPK